MAVIEINENKVGKQQINNKLIEKIIFEGISWKEIYENNPEKIGTFILHILNKTNKPSNHFFIMSSLNNEKFSVIISNKLNDQQLISTTQYSKESLYQQSSNIQNIYSKINELPLTANEKIAYSSLLCFLFDSMIFNNQNKIFISYSIKNEEQPSYLSLEIFRENIISNQKTLH